MKSWGIFFIIMGVGSLVLPLLGVQFILMSLLDSGQPWSGIGVALVGGVMIYLGSRNSDASAE